MNCETRREVLHQLDYLVFLTRINLKILINNNSKLIVSCSCISKMKKILKNGEEYIMLKDIINKHAILDYFFI